MMDYPYAGRKALDGGKRRAKPIDMDYVYGQMDLGRTAGNIAGELGVSVKTLQRRHKKYQEEAKIMQGSYDGDGNVSQRDGEDPFAFLDG